MTEFVKFALPAPVPRQIVLLKVVLDSWEATPTGRQVDITRVTESNRAVALFLCTRFPNLRGAVWGLEWFALKWTRKTGNRELVIRLLRHDRRRSLRASVEIDGVDPFWEDHLDGGVAPPFGAAGVRFDGVTLYDRCVVPTRDIDTGDPLHGFRECFPEKRRETFPEWADRDAFDHYCSLLVIASVPESDRGKRVAVDDEVSLVGG